jgi:hypothetical protein
MSDAEPTIAVTTTPAPPGARPLRRPRRAVGHQMAPTGYCPTCGQRIRAATEAEIEAASRRAYDAYYDPPEMQAFRMRWDFLPGPQKVHWLAVARAVLAET